jgi:hypothetical protein
MKLDKSKRATKSIETSVKAPWRLGLRLELRLRLQTPLRQENPG